MKSAIKFILTLLFVLAASRVLALSCAPPAVEVDYQNSDYVFIGHVIKIEDLGDTDITISSKLEHNSNSRATIGVKTVFKGVLEDTVEVYASNYWGETFVEGEDFLIFAKLDQGELVSYLCSNTRMTQYVEDEEIAKLWDLTYQQKEFEQEGL